MHVAQNVFTKVRQLTAKSVCASTSQLNPAVRIGTISPRKLFVTDYLIFMLRKTMRPCFLLRLIYSDSVGSASIRERGFYREVLIRRSHYLPVFCKRSNS